MSHRILLVGDDPRGLAPLEASLRRQGQSVIVASDGQQAAALARQFLPSVVVVGGDIAHGPGREWMAVLVTHPATTALPVVVVTPPCSVDDAMKAFQSGVAELLHQPVKPEQLIAGLDALLGSSHDAARRALAIDRRGNAVLRRIGAYLRRHGATGSLVVDAAGDAAHVPFDQGQVGEAVYGDLRADGALHALLAHPVDAPWAFRFETAAAATAGALPAPAPDGDDDDEDDDDDEFAIDVEEDNVVELAGAVDDTPPSLGGGPPPRLLVVDDDPALVGLYGKFLARAGFAVSSASDGKQGYEAAVKQRPDVILSDIMMPETDGWGLLTLVRDDFRLRETRFLLISCHHDYVAKLRELSAGADDYLAKGLRGDAVVEHVVRAIAPRRQMLAELHPERPFRGALAAVGIQTLLEALGDKQARGTLTIDDGQTRYNVGLFDGRVVSTTQAFGGRQRKGNDALLSLLALDDAPFVFDPRVPPPDGPGPRFGEMREALCQELNDARDRARERMVASDSVLELDPPMLSFYRMVCPTAVRAVVEELQRGTAPREVMASGIASPVLVEWVVKDLLRKRIGAFAASKAPRVA